jgi:hypothetical protein
LFVRATFLIAASAVSYYAISRFLPDREFVTPWLGPVWVAVTYGFLGLMFFSTGKRTQRGRDRRSTSRVPVALPVRYSTEEGEVGVGVLVDVTRQGAGLLVPRGAVDADRVWLQFLGFDDYTAVQGRITNAQLTEDATRLGLALDRLQPETSRLLTEFLIPFGHETLLHLSELAPGGLARPIWWFKHRQRRTERPRHLPVLVEQGVLKIWAVTQAASDEGAVLLLPQGLPNGVPVRISTWGSQDARQCRIVKSEVLKRSPFPLSRVIVRFEPVPSSSQAAASAPESNARPLKHDGGDRFTSPAVH